MSSSLNMVKTGVVTVSAATKKVVLGFKPRYVKVFNEASLAQAYVSDQMSGKCVKQVAAGTTTYDADALALTADGFQVGADAEVCAAGKLQYVAYEGKND